VKLVAELESGVTTETEFARIERDAQVSLAEFGLRLEEAKRLTAALQAEMVPAQVAALCRWMRRRPMRDVAGIEKLRQHVADLLGYLGRNEAALVHYAARRQRGEPIATSFVESAIDEIIAWRMAKAQQMRWSRATVQPFLDVRTAVLNNTLEDAFRRRHPGFRPTRPANDDRRPTVMTA
jgi:hypothetical protein